MKNAAQAYFQTKVSTTDQGQLLLMLYDGALNFLQQARDKMLAKDYAAKGLLISKTIDIVTELSNTLNMEKGGTLAENLNNLYFLCTARLLQANLKMNVEQLDSVVSILSGLRSAYAQIIETPEAQKAAAQIAVRMNTAASMSQRAAPIMAPPVMAGNAAAGKLLARAAYGQQNAQGFAAPPAPSAAAPVAASAVAPVAASAVAPAAAPVAAPVAASAVAPAAAPGVSPVVQPAASNAALFAAAPSAASVPASVTPASVTPASAPAQGSPAGFAPAVPPAAPPAVSPVAPSVASRPAAAIPEKAQGLGLGLSAGLGGGLSKRMSGYGKFAQGA